MDTNPGQKTSLLLKAVLYISVWTENTTCVAYIEEVLVSADTLLIVEDSFVQAKIIRKQFEAFTDFTILVAASLAQAEELIAAHKDKLFVAIVGLNLPDAPRGEAVDMCGKHDLACIVLTASFDEALRQQFLDKRVADYFLKGSIDDIEPLTSSVQRLHANHRVKALVVDDSATQRNVVQKMLAAQCIASLTAADGVEAMEVLAQNPDIRLVITDFEMPRMDGIALVRGIRGKHKINDMAVIGLSSAGSGPLTAKFLKYGANDFLTKPFEAEEFYWRVNQTLNVLDVMRELRNYRGHTGKD
jgi:PleD family two-component response regulator